MYDLNLVKATFCLAHLKNCINYQIKFIKKLKIEQITSQI